MAAPQELRRRMKSVASTKQITKAMELVSASKMRRTSRAAVANRPFSQGILNLLHTLKTEGAELAHPLMERRPNANELVVILASDRGLAGSYNSQLLRTARRHLEERKRQGVNLHVITVGNKAYQAFGGEHGFIQSYPLPKNLPAMADIHALAQFARGDFLSGRFDAVTVIATGFVSLQTQEPRITHLLPLQAPDLPPASVKATGYEPLIEPSRDEVLAELIPYLMDITLLQVFLDASASEHAARRMAMKNASDNAGSMTEQLNLTYNRIRQSAITQEIAEITGGAAASA